MQSKQSHVLSPGWSQVGTLVDLLKLRASQHPEQLAYTYLVDGEDHEIRTTYAELDLQARTIGNQLARMGLGGQRALLLYPPGLDFIAGFFGCLYGGLVAVPAYPPDPTRLKRSLSRLGLIAADAEARVVLTTQAVQSQAAQMLEQAPALRATRRATRLLFFSTPPARPATPAG
jgi:acyl-CoA synthetase (AMP-forming)/AMP-acid ligase II